MTVTSPSPTIAADARAARLRALGPWQLGRRRERPLKSGSGARRMPSLDAAIAASGLRDGAVVAMHHHFRNGDRTMVAVMEALAAHGLSGLTLAASSVFPVHEGLVPLIRTGVIGRIVTDYMRGPVADAVMAGALPDLAVLQSHGGRARAIASGELPVDACFVAAPLADSAGAATGRGGRLACGPLGYAMVDAAYARWTVILAAEVSEVPLPRPDIPAAHADFLVEFAEPGDPSGIVSGTTVPQETREARAIAELTVQVIEAAELIRPGFSFQTGAGGASLAAVPAIGRALARAGVVGEFISGGITGAHVMLLERGLAWRIRDVQSFDLEAVQSSIGNAAHQAMSAEEYASPDHPRAAVDDLTVVLLGAGEIDRDFNVNVALGGDRRLIGGPGGHPDTAQGAELTIVTTGLTGGGFAKVVEDVACVTTPGDDVDVLVTEVGIAVNPARADLAERLAGRGLPVAPIEALIARSARLATRTRGEPSGRPVVAVERRDAETLDAILSA